MASEPAPVVTQITATSVSPSALSRRPRRGGPYPRLRVDMSVKVTEGFAVVDLVLGHHLSFRQAAARLGMSPTTAWRRYWWFMDWQLPAWSGLRSRRLPPMRGTRACPRGRPFIEELDGPGGPLYQGGVEG